MSLLYEGKAKRVFTTNIDGQLRVEYKDEVTAGNGAKKDTMIGKGKLNNQITSIIFDYLTHNHIDNHFIKQLSQTEQLVQQVDIIPLEVVVRNIATGSITKRLGFKKGHTFEEPLVEFFYKKDELNDPLITDDHVKLLGIANDEEIKQLKQMAKDINQVLIQWMNEVSWGVEILRLNLVKPMVEKFYLQMKSLLTLVEYGIKIRILTLIKMYIETTLAR